MPNRDGTGPSGLGQLTGRRMGNCVGNNAQGYTNQRFERFSGRGFGRGFNARRGFGTNQEIIQ